MKLINLYKSILRYVKLEADENGFVYNGYKSVKNPDQKDPTTIGGARLVLPYPENLKNYIPGKTIIFHPLYENILRGESDVLVAFRSALNVRLNYTIAIVAKSILSICANPELLNKIDPDQASALYRIGVVDDTCLNNFITLINYCIKKKPEGFFISLILRKGITLDGKRYSRAGIVKFPIMYELNKEENPYGLKLRQKDIEIYKNVFEFILPELNIQDRYSFGSDSGVAPSIEAIMKSSMKVASRLNDILEEYKDNIDGYEDLIFDSDWVDDFNNLDALDPEIRRVPMQFGNEGSCKVSESGNDAIPIPSIPDKILPFQQKDNQQQGYIPPQAPQHQAQPQESGVIKTERGIDFNSVKNVNPMLMYGAGPAVGRLAAQDMYERGMVQQQNMPPAPFGSVVNTPNGPMVMTPNGWVPCAPTMPFQGNPSGFPMSGFQQPQQYPQQGFPQQGFPQQGFPQQGYQGGMPMAPWGGNNQYQQQGFNPNNWRP